MNKASVSTLAMIGASVLTLAKMNHISYELKGTKLRADLLAPGLVTVGAPVSCQIFTS
jgi:hypothetical protein